LCGDLLLVLLSWLERQWFGELNRNTTQYIVYVFNPASMA